jgi:hypothetical protein
MAVGREYLGVALQLRRLVPAWVESYTGPPELLAAVEASDAPSIDGVLENADALAERISSEEHDRERREWLLAQLAGISTALRWLAGERLDYRTLLERCHGASVALVADDQFEQAHALLDRALPGQGQVGLRYRAWRASQLIPVDRLHAGFELLAGEMRGRCRERFGLPDGEAVKWELVAGKTYAGNADYLGALQTLVRINTDLPISAHRLLELVCHEAYPGHHSENVCKDALGREELSVFVYPSPQALIAEGIAECAIEALLGADAELIAAECLRSAEIAYDHVTAGAVRQADALLLAVPSNVALMLDDGATSAEAHEYARTWLLDDVEHIDKAIAYLEARAWRPYESCYPVGRELCRRYTAAEAGRFATLLHRQLTPADLRA